MVTPTREQMVLMLGKLLAYAERGSVDNSRMDKKIDDLGGQVVRFEGELHVYVAQDQAAHDALSVKVEAINLLLAGNPASRDSGIVRRILELEDQRKGQKNIAIGIGLGAGLGGTGLGTAISWVGRKFGWW